MIRFTLQQLSLVSLLAGSSLLHADPEDTFQYKDIDSHDKNKPCRILEFVCATCGHMKDSENWDEHNRWRADVEQCEKARQASSQKNSRP